MRIERAESASKMVESYGIRVVIADNHSIVREGLRHLICSQPDMQMVGEAADTTEALGLYGSLRPDVIVTELRLYGKNAVEQIKQDYPAASIIVFTSDTTEESIYRALQAGAKGFVLKDDPSEVLLETIRAVASGQTYILPHIAAKLAARLSRPVITRRERTVLDLVARGLSNLDISRHLFIAEGTVKTHVNQLLRKTGVVNRTQLLSEAARRGLIVSE